MAAVPARHLVKRWGWLPLSKLWELGPDPRVTSGHRGQPTHLVNIKLGTDKNYYQLGTGTSIASSIFILLILFPLNNPYIYPTSSSTHPLPCPNSSPLSPSPGKAPPCSFSPPGRSGRKTVCLDRDSRTPAHWHTPPAGSTSVHHTAWIWYTYCIIDIRTTMHGHCTERILLLETNYKEKILFSLTVIWNAHMKILNPNTGGRGHVWLLKLWTGITPHHLK